MRGSRTAARKALQAARRALAAYTGDNLRYLCGTHLTFADVIFAECVFFDRDAYGTWGELVKDEELAELFPDVVVWASAIRGTHYADIQGNMGA